MIEQFQSHRMTIVEDAVIPLVNALIRKYPGTLSLGQGVVYYPPPPTVLDAIKRVMSCEEHHLYGPVAGLDELRTALKDKLQSKNNITLSDKQRLFITAGANMAFNAIVLALCDPGDEIIILAPYYFNHKMTIEMCSCKAVVVNTDENYQPVITRIAEAISTKTRAIVSISPNNPSGCIYSAQTLSAINALCAEHHIYHISDEAYEDFTNQTHAHFSPGSHPDSATHTISIFSFSKSYGFASWRIGYMIVPCELDSAIHKVQDNILICPPTVSQFAALECLKSGADYVEDRMQQIVANRELCRSMLRALADKGLIKPPHVEGALYAFIALSDRVCDIAAIEKLVVDFGVAVIPGYAFGRQYNNCIRVSYGALSTKRLEVGLTRLAKGLSSL